MTKETEFIVSWGLLVQAKDFDEAEKKGKKRLIELLGLDAAKKLEENTDELCVSEPSEDDEE